MHGKLKGLVDVPFDEKKLLRDSAAVINFLCELRRENDGEKKKRKRGKPEWETLFSGSFRRINQEILRVWPSNNNKKKKKKRRRKETEIHLAEREITRVKEEFLPHLSPLLSPFLLPFVRGKFIVPWIKPRISHA